MSVTVIAADDRAPTLVHALPVDVDRWLQLAERAAHAEGGVGELSVTFVDRDAITALNEEHMATAGPTDVLSFPMDDDPVPGVPTLLGDIVVCPEVAYAQCSTHAGTFDDELALLVVHGVLHVLGHDHAEPGEAQTMRDRELALLRDLHWNGPEPSGFRQTHE